MKNIMTESEVENVALGIFKDLGYTILTGPEIAPPPDGINPERETYSDVVLIEILRNAVYRLNPKIPESAKEEAIKKVLRTGAPNLAEDNHSFHKMLSDGVDVEYRKDGRIVGDKVWLFDFNSYENNDFLAINQFTVEGEKHTRRPDIILFVNGIPLVVIELKNPADEKATVWSAFNQLQTYKKQIPSLFRYNGILAISDGLDARAGTITSNKEWFMPWKTIGGNEPRKKIPTMEILIRGMFAKERLLDIIRHFIVFEKNKKLQKKMAAYHQYDATNNAIASTKKAIEGNKKAGVVWHTQGSGKSLTMVFYTGKMVLASDNPTIVVLTDRNDLDDQLFGTFSKSRDLLRQKPVQAESREDLKEKLKVASGGIVFTTIQKFFPEENRKKYPLLSDRKNIIVIADEAHRSQYGFGAKVIKKEDKAKIAYGFAKYVRDALPNASFIGFTGTPIEKEDKSTPAVFGDYVDIYDVEQAVEDGATVRIFYESRLAKIELKPEERPKIDKEFEEVTEKEETSKKEKLKSKWARLEKVVGSKNRVKRIAKDIIKKKKKRLEVLEGKGIIVGMSRRICVELFNEIIKLRPNWYHEDDDKGFIKVVMTGSASDPLGWQEHIRNKSRRRELGDNFKDPKSQVKLVIVRDMWLTGFDAPCLHTMYIDKPMRGHTLMQAIARVNRVFKDKPGGLIVDYIGIAYDLKKALNDYTRSGGKGKPTFDQEKAIRLMLEKYEILNNMFHGFHYEKFFKLDSKEKMSFIPSAIDFILKQKDGKERYVKHVTELVKAFSLAVPSDESMEIKDEVGFFQAVKSAIVKTTSEREESKEELDTAINQLISKAIVSDRVIDILAAAGLKKPDISILSEDFLMEVKELPQKNLALEALRKLLTEEIKVKFRKNLVKEKSFQEMLENTIKKYINRSIETAQVIEELIELARKVREEEKRNKKLNLTEDEIAFYDALGVNDSAVKVLGDETLRKIALELTEILRKNVTIDWTLRESVQAKLRVLVKRILKKYNYPPDKQKKATETILEQAKVILEDWTNGVDK